MVSRQSPTASARRSDEPEVTVRRDAPAFLPCSNRDRLFTQLAGHGGWGGPDVEDRVQGSFLSGVRGIMYRASDEVNPPRITGLDTFWPMDIHERLRLARENAGFTTSTEASRRFGWTESTYRHHENGTREFRRPTAEIYAKAFRVPVEWLLFGKGEPDKKGVPLVGYVGAGAEVFPLDDGGALDWVEPMPGIGPNAVAVKVKGNSMFPRYFDGDVLVYDRHIPPRQAHGQECVVRLTDGRVYVKTVRYRSGLVTLESFNAPTIDEAQVEWAAPIMWVRRTGSFA